MGQSEVSTGQDEAPSATWRHGCARHVAGEGFPRGVTPHTSVSGAAAKFSGAGEEGGGEKGVYLGGGCSVLCVGGRRVRAPAPGRGIPRREGPLLDRPQHPPGW